jgi:hypothetical protein
MVWQHKQERKRDEWVRVGSKGEGVRCGVGREGQGRVWRMTCGGNGGGGGLGGGGVVGGSGVDAPDCPFLPLPRVLP